MKKTYICTKIPNRIFPVFFRLIYRLNLKNKNINKKIGHLKYCYFSNSNER